jgi:hypothetical protein
MSSAFDRLKPIPNPPPESDTTDPNPGVEFVVYAPRLRLWEVTAITGEVGGRTTVQPRALPEGAEWYFTVLVPWGKTALFKERLWEEGISFYGEPHTSRPKVENRTLGR